jgi:MinD-like ATPase involved in chromosome partitioning or flagellar assembly
VVVNAAKDSEEGGIVFRQISLAADRFLGRTLRYEGHVPEDQTVKDCGLAQQPFVGREVHSPADRQIRRLASRLAAARPGAGPWPGRPADVSATRLADMEAPRCA